MSVSKTVIISCAGMGKRLGIGTTKCLVDVAGESLLIRNLKMLDSVDDIRIVVGFQAEEVIKAATNYRKDITFVFNHDYSKTNTGDSVNLAAKYSNEFILTIDGDLLIHPNDMKKILDFDGEFIGVTEPGTDNPVLAQISGKDVLGFSREDGLYEWTGVTQVRSECIQGKSGHTYELIEDLLPIPYMFIRTKEIDTPNDYENAVKWVRNGYKDEMIVGIVGGMGSYATVDFFRRIVDAFPARYEWERPRILIDNRCTMPSRVRAILYGEKRDELVRQLADSVQTLSGGGCTDIFLACNTSHCFLEDIKMLAPKASQSIVNIIDLLAMDVASKGISKVYLLASEGTIASNIYQDYFAKYNISVISASREEQEGLRSFIEAVKQNKITRECRASFLSFLSDLKESNIILGCTELPVLLSDNTIEDINLFDPMQSVIDYLKTKSADFQI